LLLVGEQVNQQDARQAVHLAERQLALVRGLAKRLDRQIHYVGGLGERQNRLVWIHCDPQALAQRLQHVVQRLERTRRQVEPPPVRPDQRRSVGADDPLVLGQEVGASRAWIEVIRHAAITSHDRASRRTVVRHRKEAVR
jgi:hypothetical protein